MPKIPGVNHLRAVRALEKAGFYIIRDGKKHTVNGVVQMVQSQTYHWFLREMIS